MIYGTKSFLQIDENHSIQNRPELKPVGALPVQYKREVSLGDSCKI